MIKIITIGVGIYLLYRMIFPKALKSGSSDQNNNDNQSDDTIDIDYEEIS